MIEVNITSGRDEQGKIPPKQQTSKVISDLSSDKEKFVDSPDLCEERGEFSSKVRIRVQNQMNNPSKQYIADSVEECVNQSNSSRSQIVDEVSSNTWFYSSMDCVS